MNTIHRIVFIFRDSPSCWLNQPQIGSALEDSSASAANSFAWAAHTGTIQTRLIHWWINHRTLIIFNEYLSYSCASRRSQAHRHSSSLGISIKFAEHFVDAETETESSGFQKGSLRSSWTSVPIDGPTIPNIWVKTYKILIACRCVSKNRVKPDCSLRSRQGCRTDKSVPRLRSRRFLVWHW